MGHNPIKSFVKQFVRRNESWTIGIYEGDSHLNLKATSQIKNPVLTARDVKDAKADFVADPFMLQKDGRWYMFFEILNSADNLGYISLATSPDGLKWDYQKIVLQEPFHLSYPYVFEWQHEYYMIPETYQAREIRLYKATHFPDQWTLEKVLLKGLDYVDSSIIHFNDRWWLFSSTTANDILRLHYADSLLGEWIEHPSSPIMTNNPHLARPSGRVVDLNGRLMRFAQDDYPTYGRQVRAFEITELTPSNYAEQEMFGGEPILGPSGSGWNANGMHHIDLHQTTSEKWLACVDAKGRDAIKVFGLQVY